MRGRRGGAVSSWHPVAGSVAAPSKVAECGSSYPFAILVHLDIDLQVWVACVGPYATQARTLAELFESVHDMLHGLIATCEENEIEIPFGYPLIFEALDKFKAEIR